MSAIDGDAGGFRHRPLVKLASGGMATVYLGALSGPAGFRQIVAIKRPHAHLLEHPEAREAALAEARIAARFRHANVVHVRDVEVSGEQVQLVMDYIEGATLATLLAAFARRGERLPAAIAMRILLDACAGLAAVHEATDDAGAPLHVVHRDVSPQNILVGVDGVARVSDFGTVKEPAAERPLTTQGTLKGKPGYMAPEYVQRGALDARSDELSLAVVAWEALAGKRLFRGATDFETFEQVLRTTPPALSEVVPALGTAFDGPLGRALSKDPEARFATVRELAGALARAWPEAASHAAVGDLVASVAGDELRARREELRAKLVEMDAAASDAGAGAGARTASGAPAGTRAVGAPETVERTASSATAGARAVGAPETVERTASGAPAGARAVGAPEAVAEAVTQRASGADLSVARATPAATSGTRRAGAIALGLVFSGISIFAAVRALRPDGGARPPEAPAGTAAARSIAAPPATPSDAASAIVPAVASSSAPASPAVSASAPPAVSASAPPSASAGRAAASAAPPPAASARATSTKRGPKPPPPNPY